MQPWRRIQIRYTRARNGGTTNRLRHIFGLGTTSSITRTQSAEALVDIRERARTGLRDVSNNPPAYFQRTFVEKMAQSFESVDRRRRHQRHRVS